MKKYYYLLCMVGLFVLGSIKLNAQDGNDNPTGVGGVFSGLITSGGGYDPYTGSAIRKVVDLEVAGAVSSYPLRWTRVLSSRGGSVWRHSYWWRATPAIWRPFGTTQAQANIFTEPNSIAIALPDGRDIQFSRATSSEAFFSAPSGVPERVYQNPQDKSQFYLFLPDGGRIYFKRSVVTSPATYLVAATGRRAGWYGNHSVTYLFRSITDPFNRTSVISYDSRGLLYRVTDPSGRFLQCNWVTVGSTFQINIVRGSDGQWVDYDYAQYSTEWLLRFATYSDDTPNNGSDNPSASYTYQASNNPGTTAWLPHIFRDCRNTGPMGNIQYKFATGGKFGRIQTECLPVSGENAIINVSSFDLPTHTETRGDGQSRAFTFVSYNMSSSRDFRGFVTSYAYSGSGYLSAVTDALNQTTLFERTPVAGQVTKVTNPDSTFTTTEYTDSNNPYWVSRTTDELGRVTIYTRDGNNWVTRADYPDTSYEAFNYNGFGEVLSHRMRNGQSESFSYDPSGLLLTQTDPFNQTTTFSYDGKSRVAAVTDPLNRVTRFLYNERGQLTRTTYPDGNYLEATYDINGNQSSARNELGQTSYTTYDQYKRPVATRDPLNNVATINYSMWGGPAYNHTPAIAGLTTSPAGRQTSTVYDVNFRPSTITTGFNSSSPSYTSISYDAVGQPVSSTDPVYQISTVAYDNRGRRISSTDALGHTTAWTYDPVGNVLTTRLADGTTTTNTYDAMNRVVTVKDPLNQTISMGYDLAGNMTSLTDKRGKIYLYQYDALNRQTRLTYPDNTSEASTYNDDGTLATFKNRSGNIESYLYDVRSRLVHSSWSANGDAVDYAYDAAGHPLDISNGNSALHYTYDGMGRQLSEQQTITGLSGKTISSTYDNDGLRTTLTYPNSFLLNYTWNLKGELQTIQQGSSTLVSYLYDNRGSMTKRSLLSGNTTDYVYDAVGNLDLLTHKRGSTAVASYDYGYNSIDNRTYQKRESGLGDAYRYDANQQLTGVKYNAQSVSSTPIAWSDSALYAYDAEGNRQTHTYNSSPAVNYVTGTNNVPVSIAAAALGYDGNRNLKTWNGWTYTHSAENKLLSATGNGVTASFLRDPLGRVVKTTVNGIVSYIIYDGWEVLMRFNSSGLESGKIIHGGSTDEIVCRSNPAATYYHQYDGLGSTSHVFDPTGNLLESYDYDAYGYVTIQSATGNVLLATAVGNRYLFTGREYIAELNLYDYRNRIYSPEQGRFLEPDPMGFDAGDDNMYRYCGNDPVNKTDANGENGVPVSGRPGVWKFTVRPGINLSSMKGHYINNFGGEGSFDQQCMSGAQNITGTKTRGGVIHDAPNSQHLFAGPPVGSSTTPGTMVATGFDKNGRYPSQMPQSDYYKLGGLGYDQPPNHTGIFLGLSDNGKNALIYSQSVGNPLNEASYPVGGWREVYGDQPYDPKPSESYIQAIAGNVLAWINSIFSGGQVGSYSTGALSSSSYSGLTSIGQGGWRPLIGPLPSFPGAGLSSQMDHALR